MFCTLYIKWHTMQHLSDKKLSELSEKWLKGTITTDELVVLEAWYNSAPDERVSWTAGDLDEKQLKERLFYNIDQSIESNSRARYFRSSKIMYAVAASITLLLGSVMGYMALKKPVAYQSGVVTKKADTTGNSYNKAVLTLANGQAVQLDDAANGVIAQEGGARIKKTSEGEIAYHAADADTKESAVSINMISTPKGGQYHISLPDGSKVWLNAMSSLKFPTVFKGKERIVELSGEAYFEVAKDKAMPFRVKMPNETSVAVLGTHFNIMAYPGVHSVNATLLEGSIKVQRGSLTTMVSPGEMAEVTDKIAVRKVDAEEAISWKNGLFRFEKADVRTVMQEIERWYNVDVTYEGGMPDNEITGFMSRASKLNEVLKMLELSGLKLKVQGNKIIVFKN